MLDLEADELVVDNFAGGGGASEAIEDALGRPVDIAINHDEEALAMHAANHPHTQHMCESVWKVDIRKVVAGRRVGLAWFSPDCTFHSKARGGKPIREKGRQVRGLAWVALRWAGLVRPRVICLENVEEFVKWGMVHAMPRPGVKRPAKCHVCKSPIDGRPCPRHVGATFKRWVTQLRNLGYKVDWRELRACHYGAPTIRKRLFLVARCDGQPIVWPAHTHGKGLLPFRTAAECIDWSLPCPSIFLSKQEARKIGVNRPLAEATLRRIARGIRKYVIESARPFIVPITHTGGDRVESIDEPLRTTTTANRGERGVIVPSIIRTAHGQEGPHSRRWGVGEHSVNDPLPTATASGDFALMSPTLIQTGYGEREGQNPRAPGADKPLGTVVASGGKHAIVSAFMSKYYGERHDGETRGSIPDEPLATQPTENRHAIVTAHLQRDFGKSIGSSPNVPLGTVTAGGGGKAAIIAAHIAQHNTQRGEGVNPGRRADEPLATVTASGSQQSIIFAHMVQNNEGRTGYGANEPLSTITARGTQQMIAATSLVKMRGTNTGGPVQEPLQTVSAKGTHFAEVRAFLMKYYGTPQDARLEEPLHSITTKDRFAVVTVEGIEYEIVDIGLRMLTPRELFLCQGFRPDYIIDHGIRIANHGDSRDLFPTVIKLTKTAQIRMCGNSVSPHPAAALVRAQFARNSKERAA